MKTLPPSIRCLLLPHSRSITSTSSSATTIRDAVVRCRGDVPYGSREYLLVRNTKTNPKGEILASLRAHRNILFAAKKTTIHQKISSTSRTNNDNSHTNGSGNGNGNGNGNDDLSICEPLVRAALADASAHGEQPQALATLHGLCAWVGQQTATAGLVQSESSKVLQQLQLDSNENVAVLQAVQAIASGEETTTNVALLLADERMGQVWKDLAREFAPQSAEVQLYQSQGAAVVGIELTHANNSASSSNPGEKDKQKDDYLVSAGGAMARLFFL